MGQTFEEYYEHFWNNGHSVRIVVFDDFSPANQEKYDSLLEQTRTHNELCYVGPSEKEQFLAYLNQRLRDKRLEEMVKNLFRPSYSGNPNYTLNRGHAFFEDTVHQQPDLDQGPSSQAHLTFGWKLSRQQFGQAEQRGQQVMKGSRIRAWGRISLGLQPMRVIALLNISIMVVAAQSSIPTGPDSPNSPSFVQQPRPGASQDTINLATFLVSVPVTVTDRSGRAINGLKKENFRVYENKVEQPISFFTDEDAPASIGVVFDISGSMSNGKIIQAKEALLRFIQTSHEQDEYFLISFNSTPHLLLDGTRDAQAVMDQFTNVQPGGETALYDAVGLGIEEVSRGKYPKRAIILISDGEDNHSRYTFNQLRQSLQESDVAIYTIGIGGSMPRRSVGQVVMDSLGRVVMDNLASTSGGKAFRPWDTQEMDEAFEQIALELRRQYLIGYVPSNYVADGKLHRIKVTLAVPPSLSRLMVRNREGYHAVKKPDRH